MSQRIKEYTPAELEALKRPFADPGLQLFRETWVAYAKREGGLTLQYWRLRQGPWFGEPIQMNDEACAARLNVPLSDLRMIKKATFTTLRRQLKHNPKVQATLRRLAEQRRAHREHGGK